MDYVALVILLAIMQYLFFVAMVGKARGQYSIAHRLQPAMKCSSESTGYSKIRWNNSSYLFLLCTCLHSIFMH